VALRDIARRPEGRRTEARLACVRIALYLSLIRMGIVFRGGPVNDVTSRFYHVWVECERAIGEEPLRSSQLKFVGLDDEASRRHGMTAATVHTASRPPGRIGGIRTVSWCAAGISRDPQLHAGGCRSHRFRWRIRDRSKRC